MRFIMEKVHASDIYSIIERMIHFHVTEKPDIITLR